MLIEANTNFFSCAVCRHCNSFKILTTYCASDSSNCRYYSQRTTSPALEQQSHRPQHKDGLEVYIGKAAFWREGEVHRPAMASSQQQKQQQPLVLVVMAFSRQVFVCAGCCMSQFDALWWCCNRNRFGAPLKNSLCLCKVSAIGVVFCVLSIFYTCTIYVQGNSQYHYLYRDTLV